MGPFLLENQLYLFRPFVCNSAEKGSVFHTFPIKNGMISRFLLIIPQRPVRESNPHLVLAAMGASNAFQLRGRLPDDKKNLLNTLDKIISEVSEEDLRHYRKNLRHL